MHFLLEHRQVKMLLGVFRARVDADQRADGYKILLRQLLEAGTGFFYL